MKLKIGDKVTRLWKPALGEGVVTHVLGDKVVVCFGGIRSKTVLFENEKYLRVVDEGG